MRCIARRLASIFVLFCFATTAQAITYTVNNSTDPLSGTAANCNTGNANTCTLRDAILAAVGGDTIVFAPSVSSIVVSNQLSLAFSANTSPITLDGGGTVTLDAFEATRVFLTVPGSVTAMRGLTIERGSAFNAIAAGMGGGIYNQGTLTLTNCVLSGNVANNGFSATVAGGGIYNTNTGMLTLTNSTVSKNQVIAGAFFSSPVGAGIYNAGLVTLINSTVSENELAVGSYPTSALGGGIYNAGTATLINSTVVRNITYFTNARAFGSGGGIFNSGVATLTNTTLSGNTALSGNGLYQNAGSITLTNSLIADGCFGIPTDGGGNLDSGASCGFTAASSKTNATLNLGPLQNNGGRTQTMLPGLGSAAIDFVACSNGPAPSTDQRGISRPQGVKCDSGAVEVLQSPPVPAPLLDRWLTLLLIGLVAASGAIRRERLVPQWGGDDHLAYTLCEKTTAGFPSEVPRPPRPPSMGWLPRKSRRAGLRSKHR